MIVILMGAPGAGKGTQAEYLTIKKGFKKISTGDILRRQIEMGTDLGRRIEDIMNRGHLVSDEVLEQVLKQELAQGEDVDIVLDGYPRTIPQARWLDSNKKIAGIFHIDTSRAELVKRIEGRVVCGQCEAVYNVGAKPPRVSGVCDLCSGALKARKDDSRDKINVRLDTYERETEPVLNFYRGQGKYFRIDGNKGAAEVSKQIEDLLLQISL